MVLPTRVGTGCGSQGTGISANSNFVSNITTQADDIIIESAMLLGASATATVPTGYTEVRRQSDGSRVIITALKRATGAEGAHSWSGFSGTTNRFIFTTAYRDVITSDPCYDVLTGSTEAADTSFSAALGTTVYSDCRFVVCLGTAGGATASSLAAANLTNVAEDYDLSSGGIGAKHLVGDLATAGAGGNMTATMSASVAKVWNIIALRSTSSTSGGGRDASPDFFNMF